MESEAGELCEPGGGQAFSKVESVVTESRAK